MTEYTKEDLWCSEFDDSIIEVLNMGANKYAPRDWEQVDGASMDYKNNCASMFRHVARGFVAAELKESIDIVKQKSEEASKVIHGALDNKNHSSEAIQAAIALANLQDSVHELIKSIQRDKESGLRHEQHTATRSLMTYTIQVRELNNRTNCGESAAINSSDTLYNENEDNRGGFKGVF